MGLYGRPNPIRLILLKVYTTLSLQAGAEFNEFATVGGINFVWRYRLEVSHTLRIQVYKYYLHWAPKSVNISYIGLFVSLGITWFKKSRVRG